jgi:hypothetical protein
MFVQHPEPTSDASGGGLPLLTAAAAQEPLNPFDHVAPGRKLWRKCPVRNDPGQTQNGTVIPSA